MCSSLGSKVHRGKVSMNHYRGSYSWNILLEGSMFATFCFSYPCFDSVATCGNSWQSILFRFTSGSFH